MPDVEITVEVTERDIAAGRKFRCEFSPVAIAMSRSMGQPVFEMFDRFEVGSGARAMPPAVRDWIFKHICDGPVSPITFKVSVPAEWVKSGEVSR